MYYILFLSLFIFSTSLEVKKYCNQCKYFKPSMIIEESRCNRFPLIINNKKIDLFKCMVARTYDDMCGKEGRYFKSIYK
jgi:hypothetical protein